MEESVAWAELVQRIGFWQWLLLQKPVSEKRTYQDLADLQ
jgi:hypothetical protein